MNKYEKALFHLKGVQDNADRMKEIAEKRKAELEQYAPQEQKEDIGVREVIGLVVITFVLVAIVFLVGSVLGIPELKGA